MSVLLGIMLRAITDFMFPRRTFHARLRAKGSGAPRVGGVGGRHAPQLSANLNNEIAPYPIIFSLWKHPLIIYKEWLI